MAFQPRRDSFTSQVKDLAVGSTVSRSDRVPVGHKSAKELPDLLSRLRNTVNQAVNRAKKKDDGSDFRVESGVFITDDRSHIILTVAVTKIAGVSPAEDDDDDIDI